MSTYQLKICPRRADASFTVKVKDDPSTIYAMEDPQTGEFLFTTYRIIKEAVKHTLAWQGLHGRTAGTDMKLRASTRKYFFTFDELMSR